MGVYLRDYDEGLTLYGKAMEVSHVLERSCTRFLLEQ